MSSILYYDVCTIIFDFLSFKSKHHAKRMSKETIKYNITDLLNVHPFFARNINDRVIGNFNKIKKIKLVDGTFNLDNLKDADEIELIDANISLTQSLTKLRKIKIKQIYAPLETMERLFGDLIILDVELDNYCDYDRDYWMRLKMLEELTIKRCFGIKFILPRLKKIKINAGVGSSIGQEFIDNHADIEHFETLNHRYYDYGFNDELNISNLTKLKTLIANVTNEELINFTNLTELRTRKVSNIDYLTNLEILDVVDCDVLNIEKLTKLKELCVKHGIYHQEQLNKFDLTKLVVSQNEGFYHMTNLIYLANSHVIINSNINNLTNLQVLMLYSCGMKDVTLDLPNLKKLCIENCNIKNIDNLKTLKELTVKNCEFINDRSIRKLEDLEYLDISNQKQILNISKFKKLKYLDI